MSEFRYHKDGRRFIIAGDTRVAPKGSLGKFGVGLNFDWDAKVWWTGKEDLAKEAIAVLEGHAAKRADTLATKATYRKLGDGSWGVRVPGAATSGQTVQVVKASGEAKQEVIGEVVGRDGDAVLCSIRQERKARGHGARRSGRSHSGRCRGCGGSVVDAPHHRAMDGYCGSCAFDEFDC